MRVLGLALAGALALTVTAAQAAPLGSLMRPAGAGSAPGIAQVWDGDRPGWHPAPNGRSGSGTKHPVTRAHGTTDGLRANGGRTVLLAGGGPASRPTGCGVRAGEPLIIHSRTGADRPAVGVIRS
jgi:hypothetical protein